MTKKPFVKMCIRDRIHTPFDDMIPFCEFFVIPYFMWFGFIAWSVLYFGLCNKNRREYYQLIINLGIGMTAFLVISYPVSYTHLYTEMHVKRFEADEGERT